MTITTIAIWVAYASGMLIGYKIADYRWRMKIKGMQNTLTAGSPAHGVPLREGAIRKGRQNESSNTPRPATPPQASKLGMVLMGGICDRCHRTYSFGHPADRPYLCCDCQSARLDVKV